MSLTNYLTLGRSGLRVSPFCLGAMTFGEDWGWGSSGRGIGGHPQPLPRTRRQLHRHRQRLHQRPLGGDHRRLLRAHRPPRSRRDRHEVLHQPLPRRSERRRRRPQDHRRIVRAVAAPPQDRLHRSVLDALLGSEHADRRDDARARRPGARRQGALHRRLGHAGVEGHAGPAAGAVPRLVAVRRTADRVFADRAHGRGRARADGARARPRHHAVVAAARRRAVGQVHARQRRARPTRIAAIA